MQPGFALSAPPPLAPPPLPGAVLPPSTRAKRQTELTPRKVKAARSAGVWFAIFVLLLAGAAGAFGYTELSSARSKAERAQSKLAGAMQRAAKAEQQAMSAEAELTRSKSELRESQESLVAVEQAAAKSEEELESKLNSLLEKGQGEVVKGKDGRLTLQLVDKVLFQSGEAELSPRGKKVMARVGKALEEMRDKQVWVQGHTDDEPIKTNSELFASNWELSAARALTVVHFLQDEAKVDPKRLAAAAFGSHRPISRRQKAKNRRIEIVLFPAEVELQR